MPTADTLLLVCPPDDPLGLLLDSVGGGKVPAFGRMKPDRPWESLANCPNAVKFPERALLLQLGGAPDEIGLGRAQSTLARLFKFSSQFDLGMGRESPFMVGAAIAREAPTYRLATLAADGREKES